jgi:ribonucleotide monophosphatase NagD (HAD superfamily)
MGYDTTLTYRKILAVSLLIQTGAKFIGTNPDKYTMISNFKVPGCGSMIKVIEEATAIKAEIAGKPNPFII